MYRLSHTVQQHITILLTVLSNLIQQHITILLALVFMPIVVRENIFQYLARSTRCVDDGVLLGTNSLRINLNCFDSGSEPVARQDTRKDRQGRSTGRISKQSPQRRHVTPTYIGVPWMEVHGNWSNEGNMLWRFINLTVAALFCRYASVPLPYLSQPC